MRSLFRHPALPTVSMLVLITGGGILRTALARQDLFADELATYWIVTRHGFAGVIDTVTTTAEITPPVSFLLSEATSRIGQSPQLIRLPALVAGIGSIPLVYLVGIRTVGRSAALLAAALTTLSPFMVFYSAEGRGYGVMIALVLLSTLCLLIAVDDGGRRWWVAYGLCACLAAYTHYTAVFVLAGQFAWAAWVHPRARRDLVLATIGAALLFAPWFPSLQGDIDSPTTEILGVLSPLDPGSIGSALGQWSIGFPAANVGAALSFPVAGSSLREVPGTLSLVLLAASAAAGTLGLVTTRPRLGAWFAARRAHLGLVLLLALVSPVGTLLQSAVGTNVFRTRSLAASWPYLALLVSALITVGRPAVRITAGTLAVAALGVGVAPLLSNELQRPDHGRLARFANEHTAGVIVDGAAYTPGPLTSFDVEGSRPATSVIRLNVPAQSRTPFTLVEPRPDPAEVAQRAAAVANGRPIVVIAFVPATPIVEELIRQLETGYELTDRQRMPGIFELQGLVYELRRTG